MYYNYNIWTFSRNYNDHKFPQTWPYILKVKIKNRKKLVQIFLHVNIFSKLMYLLFEIRLFCFDLGSGSGSDGYCNSAFPNFEKKNYLTSIFEKPKN